MQVFFELENLPTENFVPEHNPFAKDFKDIRENYRNLQGVVKDLGDDVRELTQEFNKPSLWTRFWGERNWAIPAALVVLTIVGGGLRYVGGLILDKHIQLSVGPLRDQLQTIQGDTQNIKGIVSVLEAQLAAQKYSSSEPTELKMHRDELKEIKTSLAGAKRDTPNFWPVSFQIIELLSKATAEIRNPGKESVVDNVSGPGIEFGKGQVMLLKNRIANLTFHDSVIRFDPTVKLTNVTFIDCVFIFPLTQNPPKPLQEIGNALLASDLSHAVINKAG
jgi:hypothetical protein